MDSVIDKEQRLSEGHPEAEDRKLDFEDLTDDEEVALNLPRKVVEERDPPGEEIRDLPGATISGASVTQQEEWFHMGLDQNGTVWDDQPRSLRSPEVWGQRPQGV